MKMYNLYRKIGNKKRQLIMTDSFTKIQNRKKDLAKSYMRQKVFLTIEEASEEDALEIVEVQTVRSLNVSNG